MQPGPNPRPVIRTAEPVHPVSRLVGIAIVTGVLGFVFGLALRGGIQEPPVMPCASDEVFVWDSYPELAVCVPDTDHESHAGH